MLLITVTIVIEFLYVILRTVRLRTKVTEFSFGFNTYVGTSHVLLPGNEYTVRIRGNQIIANSCKNRRNAIRF
jgi:hypothetical protein